MGNRKLGISSRLDNISIPLVSAVIEYQVRSTGAWRYTVYIRTSAAPAAPESRRPPPPPAHSHTPRLENVYVCDGHGKIRQQPTGSCIYTLAACLHPRCVRTNTNTLNYCCRLDHTWYHFCGRNGYVRARVPNKTAAAAAVFLVCTDVCTRVYRTNHTELGWDAIWGGNRHVLPSAILAFTT